MDDALELRPVASVSASLDQPAGSVISPDSTLASTIRAAAGGDQEAFSRLYVDYVRLVHAIVLGRVPRCEVDDLVQAVFIVAYRRIAELRDPEAFGAGSPPSRATARPTISVWRIKRGGCRTTCLAATRSKPRRWLCWTSCASCPRRTATRC
jgi:Sigma-70 region 2